METEIITSLCVIDSKTKNSVIEFMLSSEQAMGAKNISLASAAIFMIGKKELSNIFFENIKKLRDHNETFYCNNINQFDELLDGFVNYFAYGSNIDFDQMIKRCPTAIKIDQGYLNNYELLFNRKGTYSIGGVASIKKSNNKSVVWGIIYRLSINDILKLDHIEDQEAYKRELIDIKTKNKKQFKSYIYIAFPQAPFIQPDNDYLQLIINGAIEDKFPKEYITYLNQFKSLSFK